jgi:murein DD-endopeptidase MepM/ murein hydrolase activator NlpD
VSLDQVADPTASTPAAPASGPAANAAPARIKQLAQEFEAMLMTQMIREMRRSMLSDESSTGLGAGAMSDTADVELGRALSQSGGFGLTSVLLRTLERQAMPKGGAADVAPAGDSGPPVPAAPATAAAPVASSPAAPASGAGAALPLSAPKGPVTSQFGWRKDPFTGVSKFHSGVDIGLAYGTPVQAAAGGQVVFSGSNGSYGNMVVIEQPSGQQTRYAHLASQAVTAGDVVQPGQVIGQVGDTGRATGAHLHFEVLENGRAVDPAGHD